MSTMASTNRLDRPETALRTIEPAQQSAAKAAGFLYLFTMATAIFGESYVRGRLIAPGDAVQTAKNVAASEWLYRISIASDLIMIVAVVILVWALYVVLEPVNRRVALLAAFLRLVENAIAAAGIINSFIVLRVLSGTKYLEAFETAQLQMLARLFLGAQGASLGIAFVFCGVGSTVFSYLWLRSRYIPRALAALGIFSSLVLAVVGLAIMVFPGLAAMGLTYMVPMFFYEVGLGLWLLVKGIQAPPARASAA